MRFVRYTDGTSPSWGLKEETTIHALSDLPQEEPDLTDLSNSSYRSQVARRVENEALAQIDADSVSLLAPVPRPGKIVCCGLNYRDHADLSYRKIEMFVDRSHKAIRQWFHRLQHLFEPDCQER